MRWIFKIKQTAVREALLVEVEEMPLELNYAICFFGWLLVPGERMSENTQHCRKSLGKGVTGVSLLNFLKNDLDFLSAVGPRLT